MTKIVLTLLLAGLASSSMAGPNEDLLSAQMAYQRADSSLKSSQLRISDAKRKHTLAEQRLADAQNALATASTELGTIQEALNSAEQAMDSATRALQQAWQNKEAAQ
ncbi:hypothetical protein [Craterilacuibacter sp.]|uniref:hypothetical protein n=1 Tax=Craterilacuibacter sp. TaxID=2870909 RepID=UPI003F2B3CCD